MYTIFVCIVFGKCCIASNEEFSYSFLTEPPCQESCDLRAQPWLRLLNLSHDEDCRNTYGNGIRTGWCLRTDHRITFIYIGITCRYDHLDHAFKPHCTISPNCYVGHRHTSLDPVAASNAFLCNFANNVHRNSIQLSHPCAMSWKSHF